MPHKLLELLVFSNIKVLNEMYEKHLQRNVKVIVMLQKLEDDFIRLKNSRKTFLGLKLHLRIRLCVPHYCTLDDIKCQVEDTPNRNCSGGKGGTNIKTNYETTLPIILIYTITLTSHTYCISLFFSCFQCFQNLALEIDCRTSWRSFFACLGESMCVLQEQSQNAQLFPKGYEGIASTFYCFE